MDLPAGGPDPAQRHFRDVVIGPYEELLDHPHGGSDHKGGPAWPDWGTLVSARHCRGGTPVDVRPTPTEPRATIAAPLAWGGPLVRHFGHQVADFSMRILGTLDEAPDVQVAFATKPDLGFRRIEHMTIWFQQVLDWYGLPRERRLLITEPTLARELLVMPQAEQLPGPGPSPATLDRLDLLAAERLDPGGPVDQGVVYVSRAGMLARFAGEAYLERSLVRAGVQVIRPESLPIRSQLNAYRGRERLIFAEGSAMHALQLAGRMPTEVTVLVRRRGSRVADALLRPRLRDLAYADVSRGVLHGLIAGGQPALSSGLSVLDEERLLAVLADLGVPVREHWQPAAFAAAVDDDALDWLRFTARTPRASYDGAIDRILGAFAECGLEHLLPRAAGILNSPLHATLRRLSVARTGAAGERPTSPEPRTPPATGSQPLPPSRTGAAPWTLRRIQRLAEGLGATRYLEIGCGAASPIWDLDILERVGVSLPDRVPFSEPLGPNVDWVIMPAVEYFATLEPSATFDVILLKGVHTFEHAYRDLCNALLHTHERSVMLLDDTVPSDPYSSLRDPTRANRARATAGGTGQDWHGDVFKVVYAIHDFHPGLEFRTIAGPGNPQTLLWRSRVSPRVPVLDSLEAISRLAWWELVNPDAVMRPTMEDEAIGACLAALS